MKIRQIIILIGLIEIRLRKSQLLLTATNIITKIFAKESLNTLNKIKNAEIIKYKKRTLEQK